MRTMIALIGEQPIPNLLPIRYLKPKETILVYTERSEPVATRLQGLISNDTNAILCQVDAYDFEDALKKLGNKIGSKSDLLFNLTGGTKMMALAAFAYASKNEHPFVYLQSEGHKSLLFRYQFADGLPILDKKEEIPSFIITQDGIQEPLITAADYLNAHLRKFKKEGFSRDKKTKRLTNGGLFEEAVYNALEDEFDEVLAGVRPEDVANQIEIDLVIRCGNQVGIAEVKLGDAEGKELKKGLDQLQMAGGREYLGIYTAKFLITERNYNERQFQEIYDLAEARNVNLITDIKYYGYQDRNRNRNRNQTRYRLQKTSASRLVEEIKGKLSG